MNTLDLCLPAYNEARSIEQALRILLPYLHELSGVQVRVLVAENGSTDDTAAIVYRLNLPEVALLRVPGKGKGYAVRYAAAHSDADFFGFTDVDLSADPAHLTDLLQPLLENRADLVIGSRLLNPGLTQRSFLRTLSSRTFHLIAKVLLKLPHKDTQCGLKIMNQHTKSLFLNYGQENGWFFDLELLAFAHKQQHRILEQPIRWRESFFPDRPSKLHLVRDGLSALSAFLRIRQRTNDL